MASAETFRAALAIDEDASRATEKVANDLIAQGSGGSLGFVYVTDRIKSDLATVVEHLRTKTGVKDWVGTVGFGVMAGQIATYNESAIAAMITPWPESVYKVFDAVPTVPFAADKFGMPTAIVHVDPRNRHFDNMLKALGNVSQAYLLGGLTASRTKLYDQVAGTITQGGISGVILSPDVQVAIGVSQGCSAIGPIRTITDTYEGLVSMIDGEPALQALLNDLSVKKDSDLRALLQSLHVGLPVPHCDTGDYVVRNIAGIDTEKGYVAVADNVEPGQKMFFCRRDRDAATKDLTAMVQKLHARANTAKGAIYVSCCARGPHMFESAAEEIGLVQSILGDMPMVGFYANGELAGDRIYGYTGVLALF